MFSSAAGQQESHNHSLKLSTWSLHRAHVPGWGCAVAVTLSLCHAQCELRTSPYPWHVLPASRQIYDFNSSRKIRPRPTPRNEKKTFINILHPSSLTKRAILMKWWMYCLTQEGNDSCYVITWTNHTIVHKETNFTRASLSPLFSPWSYRRLFVFEFLCPYNLYTPMVDSALTEFHSLIINMFFSISLPIPIFTFHKKNITSNCNFDSYKTSRLSTKVQLIKIYFIHCKLLFFS